jgi:CBS domain containing-hemolysin-like protein
VVSTAWLVVLAVVLALLAGLLVAAEAALTSFSTVRADELVREGRRGAPRLRRILEDPGRVLSTTIFVRLGCELGAAVLVTTAFLGAVQVRWQSMLAALAVLLVASFVLVGVAPRTLGRQHAERVALAAAGPLGTLTSLLGPLSGLLILVGNALTPGPGYRHGPFATEVDLRVLVDQAERDRLIEQDEREMIHSVFELGDTIAREVMVPRTDMVVIEHDKTLRQAMSLALRGGFSRIPVVGDDIDDIVGVAYLKDVTRRIYEQGDGGGAELVSSVMRPPFFVPDSKPVDALLREMQGRRTHVAIVVDEYGGTAGLVTIEDVLEEIVGEIVDEYDPAGQPVEQVGPSSYRVSSRLAIDELGELFGTDLEDDDVDSVGGLLAKELGRVPIPGASVETRGLRLVAEQAAGRRNRIGTVLVSQVPEDGHAAPADDGTGAARPPGEVPGGVEQHGSAPPPSSAAATRGGPDGGAA